MKMKCLALLLAASIFSSCKSDKSQSATAESSIVTDSVFRMTANIAADVSNIGPQAWLRHFENTPGFFMANEGELAFHDYPSAKTSILTVVVKKISRVKLKWSNVRVDSLTGSLAAIGADFHEDQVLANKQRLSIDGYFTGVAHFDGHSWKLRNSHWSVKPQPK
jgi:hypothetical protein